MKIHMSPFFTVFGHKCRVALLPPQRNHSVTPMISIAIEGPKFSGIKFWFFMKPVNFVKFKLQALRNLLPGYVWRTQFSCDSRDTCGGLEFWGVRKNAFAEMYGDGPDNVSPVSFFEAFKLKLKGQTRRGWGQ